MIITIQIPFSPSNKQAAEYVRKVAGQVLEGWDHGTVRPDSASALASWEITE